MTLICGDCNLRKLQQHNLSVERGDLRLQENVFWFQITVNEPGFLQDRQSVEKLGSEDLHKLGAEALELVLFDQFVQIR
jgi:hypothetical protein